MTRPIEKSATKRAPKRRAPAHPTSTTTAEGASTQSAAAVAPASTISQGAAPATSTSAGAPLTTSRTVAPMAARRRRRRAQPRPSAVVFDTVQEAAAKLGLDEEALRSRCRRAARKVDGQEVAQLGGGITAFKLGTTWRIRFP